MRHAGRKLSHRANSSGLGLISLIKGQQTRHRDSQSTGIKDNVINVQDTLATAVDTDGKGRNGTQISTRHSGQRNGPLVPARGRQIAGIAIVCDFGVVDLDVQIAARVGVAAMEEERQARDTVPRPIHGSAERTRRL